MIICQTQFTLALSICVLYDLSFSSRPTNSLEISIRKDVSSTLNQKPFPLHPKPETSCQEKRISICSKLQIKQIHLLYRVRFLCPPLSALRSRIIVQTVCLVIFRRSVCQLLIFSHEPITVQSALSLNALLVNFVLWLQFRLVSFSTQ